MVQGIIIPADNTAPLTTATLDSHADYQRALGGWIEAVDIPNLGVTMYVNEEGLIRDLPFNRRATSLWRFHVPQARDARLVDDIAVVELTDDEGEDTELLSRRSPYFGPPRIPIGTTARPLAEGYLFPSRSELFAQPVARTICTSARPWPRPDTSAVHPGQIALEFAVLATQSYRWLATPPRSHHRRRAPLATHALALMGRVRPRSGIKAPRPLRCKNRVSGAG